MEDKKESHWKTRKKVIERQERKSLGDKKESHWKTRKKVIGRQERKSLEDKKESKGYIKYPATLMVFKSNGKAYICETQKLLVSIHSNSS